MTVWIFQANPQFFDIDGFLSAAPSSMLYLANQHRDAMAVGDTVFLWHAIGGGLPALSGVVAEARIAALPALQAEDPDALPFWHDPASAKPAVRVRLHIDRIELARRIKRDWLKTDPILRDMRVLKLAAETNYRLTAEQGQRLTAIWRRALVPWDYADTIAGLWAYSQTIGSTVSVLPGSPVAIAAIKTGRVAGKGIANKISNFVSLDPRDARTGLGNTSELDRAVWARFFDATSQTLDDDAIAREFARLWPDDGLPLVVAPHDPIEQIAALGQLGLAELLARWAARASLKGADGKPPVVRAVTAAYPRDPLIVAIAQKRAGGVCEVPKCTHPLFVSPAGAPFLEVHHIEPLRDGGTDRPENVAAICPSHHREAHHGQQATTIKNALAGVRAAVADAPVAG